MQVAAIQNKKRIAFELPDDITQIKFTDYLIYQHNSKELDSWIADCREEKEEFTELEHKERILSLISVFTGKLSIDPDKLLYNDLMKFYGHIDKVINSYTPSERLKDPKDTVELHRSRLKESHAETWANIDIVEDNYSDLKECQGLNDRFASLLKENLYNEVLIKIQIDDIKESLSTKETETIRGKDLSFVVNGVEYFIPHAISKMVMAGADDLSNPDITTGQATHILEEKRRLNQYRRTDAYKESLKDNEGLSVELTLQQALTEVAILARKKGESIPSTKKKLELWLDNRIHDLIDIKADVVLDICFFLRNSLDEFILTGIANTFSSLPIQQESQKKKSKPSTKQSQKENESGIKSAGAGLSDD